MDEPGFLDAYCDAIAKEFGDSLPTISYTIGGHPEMITALLGAANEDRSPPQPTFADLLLAVVDVSLLRAAKAVHDGR